MHLAGSAAPGALAVIRTLVLFAGCTVLVTVPGGAAAQQAQGKGSYRGPSIEQPELTPPQKARLAETDALQTAIAKKDAAAVRRLIAGGMKVDFDFDEAYRGRSRESPLTMAVYRGHAEIARLLLEAGADPNRRDGFGNLPIHRARGEETRALLRRYGADENVINRSALAGLSPTQALWNVIDSADDAETAKLLLGEGADPSGVFGRETLLERALFRKRWRIARQLADTGANLQPPDGPECAEALRECHSIEAARLATIDPPTLAHLKARGLELDRAAASGLTALHSLLLEPPPMRVVARMPDGRMGPSLEPPAELPRIRALLESGADPNRRFREYTPLMIAVVVPQKASALADALVEFGGRVEFDYTIAKPPRDKPARAYMLPASNTMALAILAEPPIRDETGVLRGRTIGPLTWFVLYRRADLAVRILERERKLAASDRFLLYFAAMVGEWDLVMKVLPYVREVDAADRAGVTPLLLAADDGRVDALKALIAAGADVNARSDRSWPPFWEAPLPMRFMGHPPTKPRLVGGYTPLKIARERGRDEIADLLVQAGAKE